MPRTQVQEIKERRYIKAIAAGKTKREAGLIAGAKTPVAADKYANRLSKDVRTKTELEKILKQQKITLKRVIKPIGEALEATKTVIIGTGDNAFADNIPDHSVRLKASSMGQDLLGVKHQLGQNTPPINSKDILKAIKKGDIKELNQVVFNNDD